MKQVTTAPIEKLQQELEQLEQLFVQQFVAGASGNELMPLRSRILALEKKIKTVQAIWGESWLHKTWGYAAQKTWSLWLTH